MGLDQWLYCNSKNVCQESNDTDDEWEDYQAKHGIVISWRKANAIHQWFVANVQDGNDDCGIYEVSVSDLVKLHDTCKAVLESTELVRGTVQNGKKLTADGWEAITQSGMVLEDPSTAWELLPTKDGFFFGSIDYDQWYWWDLQYTAEKIGKILDSLCPYERNKWDVVHKDEPDWCVRFYYTSSW